MGRTNTAARKRVQRKQYQLRVEDALMLRIREYQQKVSKETGFEIGFSAAVRTLIEKGLDA
jgi:hypothetical protein